MKPLVTADRNEPSCWRFQDSSIVFFQTDIEITPFSAGKRNSVLRQTHAAATRCSISVPPERITQTTTWHNYIRSSHTCYKKKKRGIKRHPPLLSMPPPTSTPSILTGDALAASPESAACSPALAFVIDCST